VCVRLFSLVCVRVCVCVPLGSYLAGLRHSEVKELGEPRALMRPSVYALNKGGYKAEEDKPGLVELTYEHTYEPRRGRK
jgi:hypothetical protein